MNVDLARLAALSPLVALSPPDNARVNALVRLTCARALSLPALPFEGSVVGADVSAVRAESGVSAVGDVSTVLPESGTESAVVDFAEQFAVDVTGITAALRRRLLVGLGEMAFRAVVLMYVADYVPRVWAGLSALGLSGLGLSSDDGNPVSWDHVSDPSDVVFNSLLPAVARLRALDPLTSEVVRLRGASQHRCRLCNSLREGAALDAGGSETLYGDIERYEQSSLLSGRQKAALQYVDALIWSPSSISAEVGSGVRRHFSDEEAVELTLDVMRNASNKIAVSFAADTPRVEEGTEIYRILPDGQLEYS